MNAAANPKASPSNAGKIVVLGIFVVALLAASFALYWNMSKTRRCLEFWGAENVRLIQHAPKVELFTLKANVNFKGSADEPGELMYGEQGILITQRQDLTGTRGLVHARFSLTDDGSYDWKGEGPRTPSNWTHALHFIDGPKDMLILLDIRQGRLANFQTGRELPAIEKITAGWKTFVEKQPGQKK